MVFVSPYFLMTYEKRIRVDGILDMFIMRSIVLISAKSEGSGVIVECNGCKKLHVLSVNRNLAERGS